MQQGISNFGPSGAHAHDGAKLNPARLTNADSASSEKRAKALYRKAYSRSHGYRTVKGPKATDDRLVVTPEIEDILPKATRLTRLRNHTRSDRLWYAACAMLSIVGDLSRDRHFAAVDINLRPNEDHRDTIKSIMRAVERVNGGRPIPYFGVKVLEPHRHLHLVLAGIAKGPQICQTAKDSPIYKAIKEHCRKRGKTKRRSGHIQPVYGLQGLVDYFNKNLANSPGSLVMSDDISAGAQQFAELRQAVQEQQVVSTVVVVPIAAPPSADLPAGLTALFDQDAPILVRVARRKQAELGISIELAVRKTLDDWKILRWGPVPEFGPAAVPTSSAAKLPPAPLR
jgi:hypothetical protein